MKHVLTILLALMVAFPLGAQKKRSAKKSHPAAATQKRTQAKPKSTAKAKAAQPAKKGVKATKAPAKKVVKPAPKKGAKATTKRGSTARSKSTQAATDKAIKGLQGQREALKKRLQELMVINSEIDERQKNIDDIQKDIKHINGNIGILNSQLTTLEEQLADRKAKYIRSVRYMARHRSAQDNLMFVFSAKSLAQVYRRLRFVREYASYQKAQGELVRAKQQQVTEKHIQLE